MVVMDAVIRLLPGALGHQGSAQEDSYTDGLLDCPHYTRPEEIEGLRVPQVLLSGDHARIGRWRRQQALGRTWLRRPELIQQRDLSEEDRGLLEEFCRTLDGAG
jgi:tRNA (guanine37-N1)-methyltransferase